MQKKDTVCVAKISCQKWDLNPRPHTRTRILILLLMNEKGVNLESGALDHSAILTYSLGKCSMSEIKEQNKALACKLLPYKRARPVKLGEKDRPRVGSNHQPFG